MSKVSPDTLVIRLIDELAKERGENQFGLRMEKLQPHFSTICPDANLEEVIAHLVEDGRVVALNKPTTSRIGTRLARYPDPNHPGVENPMLYTKGNYPALYRARLTRTDKLRDWAKSLEEDE